MSSSKIGDSTKLFGRTVQVVVGDLDVSDLDVEFEVKKTLKPKPNTCDIQIYNLSDDSIKRLETFGGNVPCKLLVGYGTEVSQIYLGELRAAWTEYDVTGSTTTHVTTDTAAKAKKLSKIFQPVGAKTPANVVINNLIAALGLKPGVTSVAAKAQLQKIVTLHPKAGVLSGNAWQLLDDFCRSSDLEFSVQDGVVQILNYGGGLDDVAFELSSDTGLIDSPTCDSKGIVTAKCLMIPDIRPGRKVSFNSRYGTGGYIIEEAHYKGSTFDNEFGVVIKGKKY